MSRKSGDVPFRGDEGTGLDEGYERARAVLKKKLDATMAGPKRGKDTIPADDIEMKNPDGDLYDPGSAAPIEHTNDRNKKRNDAEIAGRQGSTRPGSLGKSSSR